MQGRQAIAASPKLRDACRIPAAHAPRSSTAWRRMVAQAACVLPAFERSHEEVVVSIRTHGVGGARRGASQDRAIADVSIHARCVSPHRIGHRSSVECLVDQCCQMPGSRREPADSFFRSQRRFDRTLQASSMASPPAAFVSEPWSRFGPSERTAMSACLESLEPSEQVQQSHAIMNP